MKVAIRLQQHGCKNHPRWWIVAMGYYKNRKGRFLEHLGYWLPRQGKTVQRSVILNKPRILYWLANGAHPTKRVHVFLSWVDMMPKPLIKHGSTNLYDKPQKEYPDHKEQIPNSLGGLQFKYNEFREMQEENKWIRKQMVQNEMLRQEDLDRDNFSQQIPIEKDERTKEFYKLRETLAILESNLENLPLSRRELLIRRMNQLAYHGIDSIQIHEKNMNRNPFENDEDINEKNIANKLKEAKFLKNQEELKAKIEQWKDLISPISKEEFKSHYENDGMPSQRAQREVDYIYEQARECGVLVTKLDAIGCGLSGPEEMSINQVYTPKNMKENFYIPSKNPIHPFPDLTKIDPEDYFEIGKHNPEKLNYNKGFDLPNASPSYNLALREHKTKIKLMGGRKRKSGKNFSTYAFKYSHISLKDYIDYRNSNLKE